MIRRTVTVVTAGSHTECAEGIFIQGFGSEVGTLEIHFAAVASHNVFTKSNKTF